MIATMITMVPMTAGTTYEGRCCISKQCATAPLRPLLRRFCGEPNCKRQRTQAHNDATASHAASAARKSLAAALHSPDRAGGGAHHRAAPRRPHRTQNGRHPVCAVLDCGVVDRRAPLPLARWPRGETLVSNATVALTIVAITVLGTIGFALNSVRRIKMDPAQYIVAGRSFGTIFLWVLLAGEIYTTFTFLGVAGLTYATGAPAFYA